VNHCAHGHAIPDGSRSWRAPDCLICHTDFLAAYARAKKLERDTQVLTEEEASAIAEYNREYLKRNRVAIVARHRLWRAERRLCRAIGSGDETEIQKRRYQLAMLNELINVPAAW
jgi:hypothetical protein